MTELDTYIRLNRPYIKFLQGESETLTRISRIVCEWHAGGANAPTGEKAVRAIYELMSEGRQ